MDDAGGGCLGLADFVVLNKQESERRLVAGLLGVESGQDAVIRTELYRQKDKVVAPYTYTVADFSNAISTLRNDLTGNFVDEGLVGPKELGAEGNITCRECVISRQGLRGLLSNRVTSAPSRVRNWRRVQFWRFLPQRWTGCHGS